MRHLARIVAVNAAVFVGLLLAAEALVRVLAPGVVPAGADDSLFVWTVFADGRAGWRLRPGASGEAYGARVSVTPDGTWAYTAETATSGPDVLLIGDSVTMGLGIDSDLTFAGRLAALPGVRVANPSVPGWATADVRRAVSSRLEARHDSLSQVIVVWCLNDLYPDGQPIPQAAAAERAARAPEATVGERTFQTVRSGARGPLAWLDRHSRLYRWARTVPPDASGQTYAFDRALYTDPAHQADRDRAFADIAAIRDTVAAHGLPLLVAVVPEAPQFRTGDTVPQDTIRARLERLGVRTVDLTPRLSARDFLTGDGTHLAASGHAAVARVLHEVLRLNVRAPRPR